MSDLECYKELAAKYFRAKENFEELYRIVTVEAKGYWQCLENKQKEIDTLKSSRDKLVKAWNKLRPSLEPYNYELNKIPTSVRKGILNFEQALKEAEKE